jgi:hypothetical protein
MFAYVILFLIIPAFAQDLCVRQVEFSGDMPTVYECTWYRPTFHSKVSDDLSMWETCCPGVKRLGECEMVPCTIDGEVKCVQDAECRLSKKERLQILAESASSVGAECAQE